MSGTNIHDDFHAWAFEQARRLRAGEPVDADHIAEELETLGKSQEQQFVNHLAVLIQHLLKSEYQPEKATGGWQATIREQRRRIARLLAHNPSLKPKIPDAIAEAYEIAIIFASVGTGIIEDDFPITCQYSEEQILGGPN
ncbi:MAG TPA: DUF29 domain-containing protein [Bryobacteraceae bacterium]|nr:DUF29 domain-containing protein [Bryobacteraceae bacterium]